MPGKSSRLAAIAALSIALTTSALAAEGVHIDELVVATSLPESQRDATVKAAPPSTSSGIPATKRTSSGRLRRPLRTIPCRRDAPRGPRGQRSRRATSAPQCLIWR